MDFPNRMVVAGIGTDVGKTIVSAILVEALQADYWKPIQAGNEAPTDSNTIRTLVSNKKTVIHPEAYLLSQPISPHAAAQADGIYIDIEKLKIPSTNQSLIIELAGGLMVPLNETHLNIDLLKRWKASVILVSKNYIGSINHTIMSIAILKQHKIKIRGLVFNGKSNPATENFITQYSQIPCLFQLDEQRVISKTGIKKRTHLLLPRIETLFI